MDLAAGLTRALIRAGVPVYGVTVRNVADRSTWAVNYMPDATAEHRATGAALVQSYVVDADTALKDEATASRLEDKDVRVLILWCARHFNMTPAEARAELLAIHRTVEGR